MSYREQHALMKQRHARFAELRPTALEDARLFFESCLHLRDWFPASIFGAAEKHLQTDPDLRWCRHIAVASKHGEVDRHPLPEDPKLRLVRTREVVCAAFYYGDDDDDFAGLPPDTPVYREVLRVEVVTVDGATVDGLALAARCIDAWDRFIELHGLT